MSTSGPASSDASSQSLFSRPVVTAAIFAGGVAAGLLASSWLSRAHSKKTAARRADAESATNTKTPITEELLDLSTRGELKIPLPDVVVSMLKKCRLAFLSTADQEELGGSHRIGPHVSLMRFTFVDDEELGEHLIIMSTRRDTKKYENLVAQPRVALLVHDFGETGSCSSAADSDSTGSTGSTFSITLNGVAVMENGDQAEKHRALHLKHNPEYPQFIVGDDVAVVAVRVFSARICNVQDKVQHWTAQK